MNLTHAQPQINNYKYFFFFIRKDPEGNSREYIACNLERDALRDCILWFLYNL